MRSTKKAEPKPKRLTIPEMKARGLWMWVHPKGIPKMMAQGTQEQCEAWLRKQFLHEQYTLGHIRIDKWNKGRVKGVDDEQEQHDGLPELPPDHFLD